MTREERERMEMENDYNRWTGNRTGVLNDKKDYWKPKEGRNQIHILPRKGTNKFYVPLWTHFAVGLGNKQSVVCPKNTILFRKPCPICEENKKLYASENVEDKKRAREIFARERVRVVILDRDDEEQIPKIWESGAKTFQKILDLFHNEKKEDGGFDGDTMTDLDGPDVVIRRTGTTQENTSYNIGLCKCKSTITDEVLESIPNVVPEEPTEELLISALNGDDVYYKGYDENNDDGGKSEDITSKDVKCTPIEKPKKFVCFRDDDLIVALSDCLKCNKKDKCPTFKEESSVDILTVKRDTSTDGGHTQKNEPPSENIVRSDLELEKKKSDIRERLEAIRSKNT